VQPSPDATPDLNLRKRPTQARSAALVDAILQAAAQVIEAHGEPGFTTNRVAERAGVSIGSLYQYFPNRDVILAKLVIRAEAQLRGRVEAILAQADDLPSGLSSMVAAAFEHYLAAPRLHATLAQAETRLGPLVKEELAGVEARMSDLIAAFLARVAPGRLAANPALPGELEAVGHGLVALALRERRMDGEAQARIAAILMACAEPR
jgi:AcrR family transcriptional regulator